MVRLAVLIGLGTLTCVAPRHGLAQPGTVGAPIVIGQRYELRSEAMGEVRSFQVYRPDDYDISNARYPMLMVLDGLENFQQVSATADFLAEAGKIPATLVVGIPNTDRDRDMDSAIAPGSSPFLKFITDELVPRIERDYRTHPHRVLVGHSGGGLFALYSMVNAPEVFRGYIVIAPAFGDNRELPKTVDTFLQEHPDPYLNSDVFLTADNSRGMGLSGAWELSSHLQDRASRVRDLRFTFRRYDDTHSAVPMLSVYEGLQSIFEGWQLDGDQAFALYDQGGLTAIDKHYAALSTRLGFPVAVPEDVLTGIFTSLEGLKRFAEAEQVVNKAIESFPTSPTPVYYAGRLYMQMGNNPLAVETLQKSLQLSPNYGPSVGLLRYMKVEVDGLVQEVRSTGADLARYVGRYGTSAVVFEIEQREDRLFGRTSQGEYALEPVSTTTFAYSGHTTYSSGGTVTFLIDERGRVTGLEFQGGGARLAKLR